MISFKLFVTYILASFVLSFILMLVTGYPAILFFTALLLIGAIIDTLLSGTNKEE